MFQILSSITANHSGKKGKITCRTCRLKKCVGRCHFEKVECPRPAKAA